MATAATADGNIAGALVRAPLRILVIDDDEVFRALCRRYLRSTFGDSVAVVEAEDAADAVRTFSRGDFDCVLIDYRLPDMSGTGVMRALQPESGASATPMILLTAAGNEDVAVEAMHSGAADYLSKSNMTGLSLHSAVTAAVDKAAVRRTVDIRNRQLRTSNAELRKRNSEIRRFYHSVSHEIKTPLTAAREFISLMLDRVAGPVTEEQEKMLGHALDCCDQLVSHFNDLIDSTRLETGKMRIQKRLEHIDMAVTRSIAGNSGLARARGVELISHVDPGLPTVEMDTGRISQVISNLVNNAIKFTPSGGRITLTAKRCESGALAVEVSDTGCGIEAESLPHVFDRLYQVDGQDDTPGRHGLGLGLSIARDIVALHDGTIDVESEPGRGTTFRVRLPANSAIAEETKHENSVAG